MVKENIDPVELPHVIIERMPHTEIENEDDVVVVERKRV